MDNSLNHMLHCRSIDNFLITASNVDEQKEKGKILKRRGNKHRKDIIPTTNFNFEAVEKRYNRTYDIARIHSKMTTQRIGGQVVLVPRK